MNRAAAARWGWAAYLAAPFAVLAVFFFAPLAALVRQSVSISTTPAASIGITLAHYTRFFFDSYYLSGLLVTLGTAALVTAITLLVAYPMAYTYWQAGRRLRALLVILLLSPFYANIVVKVFGWMVVLARTGPLNSMLMQLGIASAPIEFLNGYFAVVLVEVHRSLPFMVLLIAAALNRIDPELLQAARVCGSSGGRVLRRVVLPLTIPGAIAGSVLVFSLTVTAFVVPLLVGGRVAGRFLPVLMYQQITIAQNWAFGAAIGVILLIASMASIALGNRAVRSARLWDVGGERANG